MARNHAQWLRMCSSLPPEPRLMEGIKMLGEDNEQGQNAARRLLETLDPAELPEEVLKDTVLVCVDSGDGA